MMMTSRMMMTMIMIMGLLNKDKNGHKCKCFPVSGIFVFDFFEGHYNVQLGARLGEYSLLKKEGEGNSC